MPLNFPTSSDHKPTPAKVSELIARIDKPLAWIARESGISYSRMRMLVAGQRQVKDEDGAMRGVKVFLRYPEQYTLEGLAAMSEAARRMK